MSTIPKSYEVVELEHFGAPESKALALNNRGQIVGIAFTKIEVGPEGAYFRACLWEDQKITDIDAYKFQQSTARDINELSEIVGDVMVTDEDYYAFICVRGEMKLLKGPEGRNSEAFSINNHSQVVGWELGSDDSFEQAVSWQDGQGEKLQDDYHWLYKILAINDNGVMAGNTNGGTYLTGREDAPDLGFTYDGDRLCTFSIKGADNNVPTCINQAGMIAGYCQTTRAIIEGEIINYEGEDEMIIYENREVIRIGHLDELRTQAKDINNHGHVVGYGDIKNSSAKYGEEPRGIVWFGDRLIDLNDMIPNPNGWVVSSANGINDNGQIVGTGVKDGRTLAILLNPRFDR